MSKAFKNSITIHVTPRAITPVKGHRNIFVIQTFKQTSPINVVQKVAQTVHSNNPVSLLYILLNRYLRGFVIIVTGQSSPFSTNKIAKEQPNKTENIK